MPPAILSRGGESSHSETLEPAPIDDDKLRRSGPLSSEIATLNVKSPSAQAFSAKIKTECNQMIEMREKFAGRTTPTPVEIAQLPEEANRRLLELRLWDPLVRMHLSAKEPGDRLDTTRCSDEGVEVDLGARLPKQFGMFTEMVYGVTVLVANLTCRQSAGDAVPGLAWYYFRDDLFSIFDEQAQMRGLLRSKGSNCASFMLIGGMPHTKSFTSDGGSRSAGLVADVARRMIEDVAASNARHAMEERQRQHDAHEGDESVRNRKSFDVSIRIGISSGNVAINVFGQRRPIYFGACGSETDMADALAATPAGSDPDDAAIMLSDSANSLVSESFFTSPREVAVKVSGKTRTMRGHLLTGKKDHPLSRQSHQNQKDSLAPERREGRRLAKTGGQSPRSFDRGWNKEMYAAEKGYTARNLLSGGARSARRVDPLTAARRRRNENKLPSVKVNHGRL